MLRNYQDFHDLLNHRKEHLPDGGQILPELLLPSEPFREGENLAQEAHTLAVGVVVPPVHREVDSRLVHGQGVLVVGLLPERGWLQPEIRAAFPGIPG